MVIRTLKRKPSQRKQQNLTPDELLFLDIKKTFRITKDSGLAPALSIYLAMVGLRTGALAHAYDKEQYIIRFFARHQKAYPAHYRIYKGKQFTNMMTVFVSSRPVPDNLRTQNGRNNSLEIGRFLGYHCPRDVTNRADDMKKKIVFYINLVTGSAAKKMTGNRIKTSKLKHRFIGRDIIYTSVCIADETNTDKVMTELQGFCDKVNEYCRPRFPNLLPGLRIYLEHEFQEPRTASDSAEYV
jgi:hypothetical protein